MLNAEHPLTAEPSDLRAIKSPPELHRLVDYNLSYRNCTLSYYTQTNRNYTLFLQELHPFYRNYTFSYRNYAFSTGTTPLSILQELHPFEDYTLSYMNYTLLTGTTPFPTGTTPFLQEEDYTLSYMNYTLLTGTTPFLQELHPFYRIYTLSTGSLITNLKYWGRCEPITSKTLQLLNDLSIGYSSVRKLVKLSAVQFMLNNHTSEHFSFLGINNQSSLSDMRCRTTFYTALGRLLMVDLGEDEDQYEQFMLPLTAAFEAVAQMFSTNSFNEQEAKRTLVGLVRDLRGIAFAFNAKTSFMMLFEWIYPSYMPILQRAIELWYHDPACTTPVLKLMAELVHNRSQRLQFDVSSPNGILLFRETSKMITTYGNRILTLGEVPKDQVYALKLKGISICFSMLKAALSGSYVNFGVFRLYGDDALDNALQTFIKLLLSIPHSDLLDYPKLSQSYYSLLEVLTQDHMNFIASLEPHVIMYILSSISEGLTALDTMVCTGCCSCLDHIVTYLFKQLSRSTKKRSTPLAQESDRFLHIMQQHPEMIQQMLSTVLNIIIFEDCRNQWSMSRPLLGLILLNEKYFSDLRNSIVNSQPPEKQQAMHLCFENLMEGIERNLLTKNRDRFTQNLSAFRREVNDSMKNSSYGVNSNDMMS
ncbi:exportin-7 [Vidua macroura]|uniref:exportin-7 n=1 Tax=Vidua macroura TaxID=187451 RepID=UPI0023A8E067|nr:exportin-7 [Vidua macroura]